MNDKEPKSFSRLHSMLIAFVIIIFGFEYLLEGLFYLHKEYGITLQESSILIALLLGQWLLDDFTKRHYPIEPTRNRKGVKK